MHSLPIDKYRQMQFSFVVLHSPRMCPHPFRLCHLAAIQAQGHRTIYDALIQHRDGGLLLKFNGLAHEMYGVQCLVERGTMMTRALCVVHRLNRLAEQLGPNHYTELQGSMPTVLETWYDYTFHSHGHRAMTTYLGELTEAQIYAGATETEPAGLSRSDLKYASLIDEVDVMLVYDDPQSAQVQQSRHTVIHSHFEAPILTPPPAIAKTPEKAGEQAVPGPSRQSTVQSYGAITTGSLLTSVRYANRDPSASPVVSAIPPPPPPGSPTRTSEIPLPPHPERLRQSAALLAAAARLPPPPPTS